MNWFVKTSLIVLGVAVPATSANAAILITGQETGGNVVFSYSGSINLAGTTPVSQQLASSFIRPNNGTLILGTNGTPDNVYSVNFSSEVANFGTFGPTNITSSTGSLFAISSVGAGSTGLIGFNNGYTSGSFISGSSTINSKTFSTLGINTSTSYTWTLNNSDTVTLQFQSVPEPLTIIGTFLAGALGIVFKRKYQST